MSLLEILIAVLILGIGALGIAAMQASALRGSQSSMEQSQAVISANAMLDSIRANPAGVTAGSYALAMAGAPCTPPAAGGSVASKDINGWIAGMQAAIAPSACGSILIDNLTGVYTIKIQWNETADPAAPLNSISIASRP